MNIKVFIVVICLAYFVLPSVVLGDWWNDSWSYRRAVNISNTAGNLTDYQVKIIKNFSTEYSAGKVNVTCQDVRFTNSSDSLLNYWIESCQLNETDNATFWVNVTSIPNNTNTTIYMYYGNPSASSESNVNNTFDFYDDFSGSSLDSSKWDNFAGTVSVSGGILKAEDSTDGEIITTIYNRSSTEDIIIETYAKVNGTGNWLGVWVNDQYYTTYVYSKGYMFTYYTDNAAIYPKIFESDGSSITQKDDGTPQFPHDTWKAIDITVVGDTHEDVDYGLTDTDSTYQNGRIGFGKHGQCSMYIDYVRIRKYADPEPSVSNIGSEENYLNDYQAPTYSENQTNTTQAGASTLFSVKWEDNTNLTGGFIFSWHNGTNWTQTYNSGDLESGEQIFVGEIKGYFFDGFESGTFTSNWTTASSPGTYGSIDVQTSSGCTSPRTGTYYAWMDVTTSGNYETNIMKTAYDFTGASNIILDFYEIETGDEDTACTDPHTGDFGTACDGAFFTCDGNTWYQIADFSTNEPSWTNFHINISADPDFCSEVNSSFAIKIMQYDNCVCPTDGRGIDDFNISFTGIGEADTDTNKTPIIYSDVITGDLYDVIDNITVTVYVSYYNTSGSIQNGNTNATLWLEIYNGSDWVDEGDFQVIGTGNYSKTVTTSSVLSGWETESNRDIRISARYMDYNDSTHYDQINWTGVWVEVFSEQEFLNDSLVEFNSSNCYNDTVCWSNVTKTVSSNVGDTIKWRIYAKDRISNWNETPVYSYTTTSGGGPGQPDIQYGLNSGITFRFPCDLNTGTTYGEPEGQNSTLASIWCKNNGTAAGNFQAKLNQSLPSGWYLFIANSSSGTKIELNTSWQTFYWNVASGTNITNCAWFWNNCSAGSGSPHPNVEVELHATSS